jgi:hypothetical protein
VYLSRGHCSCSAAHCRYLSASPIHFTWTISSDGNGMPARPLLESLIPRSQGATDAQLAAAWDHGYTLREIGNHLALHYATVSRRVKRFYDQQAAAGKQRRARNKTPKPLLKQARCYLDISMIPS